MAQQKGANAAILIGVQDDISTPATAGLLMPVNSCSVVPDQTINKSGTLTVQRK